MPPMVRKGNALALKYEMGGGASGDAPQVQVADDVHGAVSAHAPRSDDVLDEVPEPRVGTKVGTSQERRD